MLGSVSSFSTVALVGSAVYFNLGLAWVHVSSLKTYSGHVSSLKTYSGHVSSLKTYSCQDSSFEADNARVHEQFLH